MYNKYIFCILTQKLELTCVLHFPCNQMSVKYSPSKAVLKGRKKCSVLWIVRGNIFPITFWHYNWQMDILFPNHAEHSLVLQNRKLRNVSKLQDNGSKTSSKVKCVLYKTICKSMTDVLSFTSIQLYVTINVKFYIYIKNLESSKYLVNYSNCETSIRVMNI